MLPEEALQYAAEHYGSFSTLHLSRSNAPTTLADYLHHDVLGAGFSTLHLSRSNAPVLPLPLEPVKCNMFQYSSSESFKCSFKILHNSATCLLMFQYSSSESFKCSLTPRERLAALVAGFSTLHLSRSNAPTIDTDTDTITVYKFQYSSSESFKCSGTSRQAAQPYLRRFSTLHLSRSNAPAVR